MDKQKVETESQSMRVGEIKRTQEDLKKGCHVRQDAENK